MYTYSIEDKLVDFYSIGEVAKALGKKDQAIRKWELSGRMPEASYRSPNRLRLYTKGQYRLIIDAFKKYPVNTGYPFPPEFSEMLKEHWDEKSLEFD